MDFDRERTIRLFRLPHTHKHTLAHEFSRTEQSSGSSFGWNRGKRQYVSHDNNTADDDMTRDTTLLTGPAAIRSEQRGGPEQTPKTFQKCFWVGNSERLGCGSRAAVSQRTASSTTADHEQTNGPCQVRRLSLSLDVWKNRITKITRRKRKLSGGRDGRAPSERRRLLGQNAVSAALQNSWTAETGRK